MMVLSPCTTTSTSPCRYHGNRKWWWDWEHKFDVENIFLHKTGTLYKANDCFWFRVITKHAHPIGNKSNHHQHFIDICGLNIPLTRPTPWFTLYNQSDFWSCLWGLFRIGWLTEAYSELPESLFGCDSNYEWLRQAEIGRWSGQTAKVECCN